MRGIDREFLRQVDRRYLPRMLSFRFHVTSDDLTLTVHYAENIESGDQSASIEVEVLTFSRLPSNRHISDTMSLR
jgi:hypothetical protein